MGSITTRRNLTLTLQAMEMFSNRKSADGNSVLVQDMNHQGVAHSVSAQIHEVADTKAALSTLEVY